MSHEILVPLLYFFGLSVVWLTVGMVIVRRFFDASFIFLLLSGYAIITPGLFYLLNIEQLASTRLINDYSGPLLLQGLIAVVFLLGVMIGYVSLFSPKGLGIIFPHISDQQIRSVMFVGIFLLSCSSFVFAFIAIFLGGGIIQAIELVRFEELYNDYDFLRQFIRMGSFLSIAYLLDSLIRKKSGQKISKKSIRIASIFLMINFFAALITGGKTYLIYPFFTLMIGYALYFSKSPLRTIIVSFFILAFLLITLQYSRIVFVTEREFNLEGQLMIGTGLGYIDTNLIYLDLMADNIELGEDFYNGLVGVVPRFLWPGKPENITAGGRFRRTVDVGSNSGWPVLGFNLWYSNFGWIGVILGGIFTGFVLRALAYRYNDYRKNPYSLCFLCLFTIMLLLPAGISNLILINYVLNVVPIWIFLWLSSPKVYPSSVMFTR
jgi:oligosaccharide repeat unit polymerase